MSCLRKSSMKALSEMISFWDGRGPSEKKKKKKKKKTLLCMPALKLLKLSAYSVRFYTNA